MKWTVYYAEKILIQVFFQKVGNLTIQHIRKESSPYREFYICTSRQVLVP